MNETGPEAVPQPPRGSPLLLSGDRFVPVPGPPCLNSIPSLLARSRIDSVLSSTLWMKHADTLRLGVVPAVEPHRAVERGHLVDRQVTQLVCEGLLPVLSAREVVVGLRPPSMVSATLATSCRTLVSRPGVPGCPREYLAATMLVVRCDSADGESVFDQSWRLRPAAAALGPWRSGVAGVHAPAFVERSRKSQQARPITQRVSPGFTPRPSLNVRQHRLDRPARPDDLLDGPHATRVDRQDVDLPALPLREAAVHPEQVAREQAASSPPVPARISSTTFFSSFGSFGTVRLRISAGTSSRRASSSDSSCPASSFSSASAPSASSRVSVISDAEPPDDGLNLGQRLRVRAVMVGVGLHRPVAEEAHQLMVAGLDGLQLVEHDCLRQQDAPVAPPDRLCVRLDVGAGGGGSGAGWRPPARRRRRAASSATFGRRPPGPAHSNAGTLARAPCQSTLCAGSRSSPAWARSASRPLDAERIAPPFPVRRVHVASFSRGARHVHRLVEHHRHPDRLAEQVRVAPGLARRDRPPRKPRAAPPPPKCAQRRPATTPRPRRRARACSRYAVSAAKPSIVAVVAEPVGHDRPSAPRRPGPSPAYHRTSCRFGPRTAAALESDLLGFPASTATGALVGKGGEDGRQIRRPERPRLPPVSIAGGPPVAGEDPGCPFPGQGSARRRGGARKHAGATAVDALAGAPPLVVELGEVGGEGGVRDQPAVRPSIKANAAPRSRGPVVFGLMEASGEAAVGASGAVASILLNHGPAQP